MGSWARDSWRYGAISGLLTAVAGAVEMLAANRLTINPPSGAPSGALSSAVVVALWVATGTIVGFVVGGLGGRAAVILRRRFADGALGMSILTVGHLLLPLGAGVVMAAAVIAVRQLRRRLFPDARRIDLALPLGMILVYLVVPHTRPGMPPEAPAGTRLAAAVPAPGAVPVTISVHRSTEFPAVPAIHLPIRPLDAREPGRRAALWSGRLPDRTRAGRSLPRLLPGGGGLSRFPDAPGVRLLAALFPTPRPLEGTPFETFGTIAAQCEASGIALLTHPPAPGDPPFALRILDGGRAPDTAVAERIVASGAWIDVTLTPEGGSLAFAGKGFRLTPASGEVNLVDVTPTALHLLGLPVPRSADGRVLQELMRSPGPGARPIRYRGLVAGSAPPEDEDVSRVTTSR